MKKLKKTESHPAIFGFIHLGEFSLLQMLALMAVSAVIAATWWPSRGANRYYAHLQLDILNVGQGSSALITCFDDSSARAPTQVLIDAGESDEFYPGAEGLFARNLQNALRGDSQIEYAVLTHPHRDHLFGFRQLLNSPELRIQEFIDNGADAPQQQLEEDLRRTLIDRGIRYRNLSRTTLSSNDQMRSLELCTVKGVKAKLNFISLSEAANRRLNCPSNLNNCSIVLQLQLGSKKALLAADTLTDWEAEICAENNLQSDILVAGHHGHQSTSSAFLTAVAPSAIILSTGQPDLGTSAQFGYPEVETLDRILRYLEEKSSAALPAVENLGRGCNIVLACKRSMNDNQLSPCDWQPRECVPGFLSTAVSGNISIEFLPERIKLMPDAFERSSPFPNADQNTGPSSNEN